MEIAEKYDLLKEKYKALKNRHKVLLRHLEVESETIMLHEAEILDINTKTMNDIIENNKRFNKN
jgi:hypothetical protein